MGLVILDHYAPFRNFLHSAPARYGGCGVDVFFVLSGFLITTILLKARQEQHPYRIFYARRALRILPAYALLLVFVYGVGSFLHEPFNRKTFAGQVLFLRSFKGTGALWHHCADAISHPSTVPGLFRQLPHDPLPRDYGRYPMAASLGPTWSLSVEEWFYIGWAPVVLLLSRRSIAIASLAMCFMGFVLRWLSGGSTSFFTSVDMLTTGALLALWTESRPHLSARSAQFADRCIMATSAMAVFAFALLAWIHRDSLSGTLIEVAVFGGLGWIIRNSGAPHALAVVLRWKPLAYIGSISYTVYLMHLPLYFVVRRIADVHGATLPEPLRIWIVALSSVAATGLVAAASWKFFEEPILSQKKRLTDLLSSRVTEEQGARSLGFIERHETVGAQTVASTLQIAANHDPAAG